VTRRRRHRTTVPGLTSRCARSVPGKSRISAAMTARSAQSSRGLGLVRRSTAGSCRRTSNSASLDADERPGKTSQPPSRTKIRQSRRMDTADHMLHGCGPPIVPGHRDRPNFGTRQADKPRSHHGWRLSNAGTGNRADWKPLHTVLLAATKGSRAIDRCLLMDAA